MRNDLLHSLVSQKLVLKSALLIIATIISSGVYAETCPSPRDIKLNSDGYFVAPNGWRSSYGYSGLKNPKLDFGSATYTIEESGKNYFESCRYQIVNDPHPVNMVPPVVTPVLGLGSNWAHYPHSLNSFTCIAVDEAACRFISIHLVKTTVFRR